MSTEISQSKGVYISTYGCQMNVNDTERMYSLLEMINYAPVPSPDQADLIIINSCSVREKPVHKVHSEVGRYKGLKTQKPQLKIGVGGCVAQQEKKQLLTDVPLLDFVFGTDAIDSLPSLVQDLEQGEQKKVDAKFRHSEPYHVQTLVKNPGVSTFVNITKGCDNFCTFCVVPFTRGRERSRPLKHLIEDINSLTKRGVREVTLLGQNVNSYKSDCGANFGELMRAVAVDTDIERIRFTTSHPKDFNEELVGIMQDHRDKIMDYIHLPVQSGSSEVLERMNRGYTREEYIRKAKMILEIMPGAALSSDIIVGFPGESEKQFEETMSLLEEVPYESIFSFKYSPRPFTKAARWEDHVSEEEKSRRLTALQSRHKEIAFELSKRYRDSVVDVLVEVFDEESGRCSGRSTQNKLTHFNGRKEMIGGTYKVKVNEAFPQTLRGVLFEH
ncbi:MAG: tRNA (N6-isopentenyl adenosine(37)-C2)-methylthiotransferase MiaB [Bdellovibrionales bacterium]|nr:tRNA (N6-isopentenyl adenosine(37)-C2)-methylthiotransferase MiaB [Bdellovibrionales bacterium]